MPNPQEVCVYASFNEKLKGKPKLSDRLKMEDEHKLPDGLKRSNELNMWNDLKKSSKSGELKLQEQLWAKNVEGAEDVEQKKWGNAFLLLT